MDEYTTQSHIVVRAQLNIGFCVLRQKAESNVEASFGRFHGRLISVIKRHF
jgi:hypothetical protein